MNEPDLQGDGPPPASRPDARERRKYVLDVLVDGKPVCRDVSVYVADGALHMGDDRLPLGSVFWVSRRAGLALLFSRQRTVALLGRTGDLEALSREVEKGSDRAAQRELLQPLAREVVVCTAGTAVSGTIGPDRTSGLHLAVFTQQGLHLIARDRHANVRWPVREAREIAPARGETGRGGLLLRGDRVELKLRYLFPEEVQAVRRVATRAPRDAATDAPLELFVRGEVAPAPEPRLPDFTTSAETVHRACAAAARRVSSGLAVHDAPDARFFERHFRELGEIALGPLVARRSAARAEKSLVKAVEALDAERLQEEVRVAFAAVGRRVSAAYREELDRLLASRQPDPDLAVAFKAGESERSELARDMSLRASSLDSAFSRLLARQHLLLQRLHALEHGPPEAEELEVDDAADQWRAEVEALDERFGDTWRGAIDRIAGIWEGSLLPRLSRLALLEPPRWSEPVRLGLLAVVTFLVVAIAVWALF